MGPLRIRAVSYPPLPPLKLWLPIPSQSATVQALFDALQKMLPNHSFQLEVQGFAVLLDSPLEIFDFANDIIEIRQIESVNEEPPAKRARMEPVIVTSRLFTAAPVDDSSDSDSSDSTSDSDDDPPEELPSHKPLPIIAKSNAKPASSSSSSSSDSSDSSDSDSDEEVKIPIAVVKTVPPGQGKTATHQRNARKRKAKEYAALAEASDSAVARILLPSPTVVSTLTIVTKTEAKPPPIRKDPYPYADYGAKQVKVVPSPGPSKPTVYTPVSPTCAPLPSLSPPIAELAVFPSFDFLPPIATSPKVANVSTPASKAKNHATHERQRKSREKKQKLFNKDPNNFLPAPSARTDLPSNLVVTRVDVEEIDWSAGLGEVIQGTSREWTRKEAVVVPIVAPVVAPVFEETAIALNDSEEHLAPEWRGWPAAEEIESRWNELREGRKPELMLGDRIAIHVLEIDAGSFAPTLSLKYGTLLPQRNSPSPLRMRLHPACYDEPSPIRNDEAGEGEFAWGKPRLRFGQEVIDELHERDVEVYEGEWDGVKCLDY